MPKENIHCAVMDTHIAKVGWSPDRDGDGSGYVQLATIATDSRFRWEMVVENPEHPEAGGMFDGFYVTLDREAVNRLIRALRKARDAAYGADA